MPLSRRSALALSLGTFAGLAASEAAADQTVPLPEGSASRTDFDYFIGRWRVEHRRLRGRLVGSNDWETFEGSTYCQRMFDGLLNLNESVSVRGGRTYFGLGLRGLDEAGDRWADWTLSAANLSTIDPPQYGRFANGVGAFLSREDFEGRPVLVRGLFSSINEDEARWEQAFSSDEGATWETNWVMRYLRTEVAD